MWFYFKFFLWDFSLVQKWFSIKDIPFDLNASLWPHSFWTNLSIYVVTYFCQTWPCDYEDDLWGKHNIWLILQMFEVSYWALSWTLQSVHRKSLAHAWKTYPPIENWILTDSRQSRYMDCNGSSTRWTFHFQRKKATKETCLWSQSYKRILLMKYKNCYNNYTNGILQLRTQRNKVWLKQK